MKEQYALEEVSDKNDNVNSCDVQLDVSSNCSRYVISVPLRLVHKMIQLMAVLRYGKCITAQVKLNQHM